MRLIAEVEFREVVARFRRDHRLEAAYESNTNQLAHHYLHLADEMLATWTRVRLNAAELRTVILPWHESEGGEIALVPKTGLTVGRAADRLAEIGDRYPRESPVCWGKIERLARGQRTPVFLSTRAIPGVDYEGLRVKEGLVHLDGLHRMIAWSLAAATGGALEVDAYVAGPRVALVAAASAARGTPA